MDKITWTAKNNSSFLNGERSAHTLRGAIIAAKKYADSELHGEGQITIFVDGSPVRVYEAGLLVGTPRWAWKRTDRGL